MNLRAYQRLVLLPFLIGTGWIVHPETARKHFVNNPVIHVLIFAQDDPHIGVEPDIQTIKNICIAADEEIPDNKVSFNVEVFDAKVMTKDKISAELQKRQIGKNDVVWCYYAGHGSNYDGWPKTAGTSLPLTWVNDALIETGARLTITTYDCCNWRTPEVATDLISFCVSGYTTLFLNSKGNIRMCSSQAEKFSYGLKNGGGIFTNALADNIGCNSSWETVLQKTRDATTKGARVFGMQQAPFYALSTDFKDGTNK